MSEPIRVLHVLGGLALGGAESRIMDLYRNMDRERIQFDFLVHSSKEQHYDKEIEKLGGRIYRVPRFSVYNWISYRRALQTFFAAHPEISVVHGHMTSTASIYLPIAKKAGIPVTIAHARSAGVDKGPKGKMTRLLRRNLWKKADHLFACSEEAGQAVFGDQAMKKQLVRILPNAINTGRFAYDFKKRCEMRQRLGVEDKLVVGHVGSFRYAKNHEYLLRVFACLDETAVLLLVGEGERMAFIKELAEQMGVAGRVLFAGNRSDVEDYYQAMDHFVFPSRYEGLPGSVVEAQTAGLRCLISDAITKETDFSPLLKRKSIKEPPDEWAECIKEHAVYERAGMEQTAREKGFDVAEQAAWLAGFYLDRKDGRK